jgi:thioredoxin-related protein
MKFLIVLLALVSFSSFAVTTGEMAPDFTLPGLTKEIKLSDFKGKIVVLEWMNHGCPFVRKHYDSNNMQSLQKKYTGQNVIWFSIVSSAEGKQGYVDQKGALKDKTDNKSSATDVLLDPTGKIGQLYGAKTTPHMFIIDKDGKLVYQGAIDDKADTDKASIPGAKNFVVAALDEIMAGKKVSANTTKSYGCSVKY